MRELQDFKQLAHFLFAFFYFFCYNLFRKINEERKNEYEVL